MKRIILTILAALSLPSCSTPLPPEERAALLGVVVRAGNVGIDKLATSHPQK